MAKLAKTTIAACGEHYVASFLSAKGFIVGIPRAGVPGCDLLASKQDSTLLVRVQVKTGVAPTGRYNNQDIYLWQTSLSVLAHDDPNLWYAFVALNGWPEGNVHPDIFFVSSKQVIECLEGEKDESWTAFWMYQQDALGLRGNAGFEVLLCGSTSRE